LDPDPDLKHCKLDKKQKSVWSFFLKKTCPLSLIQKRFPVLPRRKNLFQNLLIKNPVLQPHSEEMSGLTEEGEPPPEAPHKNPVLQPHSEEVSGLTEEEEPFPEPLRKNPVLQPHLEEISGPTEEGEPLPEP
jgi:hypothetical protein